MPTTKLFFTDSGEGRPVLFVHGYPLDHTMWSAQVLELSRECRALAPDLRGFGSSPLADADPTTGVSMAAYADDLARLLDEAGVTEPVVYCGFSMGGYVGWQFLARHRQKVQALVLCDTRAVADNPEAKQNRLITAELVGERGSHWIADQMEPKLFSETTRRERPEIVSRVSDVIRATAPAAIAAALRGMAHRPDSTEMLSQLDLPTLVVVGEEDTLSTRDEMAGIAEAISGAELVVVRNAGHMAPVENPAAVTTALRDFLGKI